MTYIRHPDQMVMTMGTTAGGCSTRSRRRRGISYSHDIERLSSVANLVANVAAAVVVEGAVPGGSSLSRTRMPHGGSGTRRIHRRGSVPGLTIRQRNRRSVQDIYRELGDVYF